MSSLVVSAMLVKSDGSHDTLTSTPTVTGVKWTDLSTSGVTPQAKIETTPFKAPPDTLIGIADAPPLGLSRTPRSAVWGAPVVEKCPPLCPRSSDSGGAAPCPEEP